jgi:hypothetical protein
MGRIWRNDAGIVLLAYFIACVAALGCAALGHPGPRAQQTPLAQQAPWLLLMAFLTWRVWRRGRISRAILTLVAIGDFVKFAHLGPGGWNPSVLGLLAIYAVQLALLLSPAVSLRCWKDASHRPSADALAAWAAPRLWMVLTALLAGLVVTLLFLGSMDWGALPGCGPAGAALAQLPDRCFVLQEGLPLRFLNADQGVPDISKTALIEDWAQWSLVSFSAIYTLRLVLRRLDYTPAATEQPSTV